VSPVDERLSEDGQVIAGCLLRNQKTCWCDGNPRTGNSVAVECGIVAQPKKKPEAAEPVAVAA
jgi:hypothetical protein